MHLSKVIRTGFLALLLATGFAALSVPALNAEAAARKRTGIHRHVAKTHKSTAAKKRVAVRAIRKGASKKHVAHGKKTHAKPHKTAWKKPAAHKARAIAKAIPHPAVATAPSNAQLSTGINYSRFSRRLGSGPVRVSVIEIDPQVSGIEIMPVLASGRMGSKTNVASMVSRHQAVAGINGSFFKPDVGIPLGILMINQELISGPIYDRVALGITKNNTLVMDRVRLAGEVILPSGKRVPLQNVNQPRVSAGHTVLYSARWGARAPKVPSNGIQVLLRNNRVAAVSTSDPLEIPQDGMIISGSYSPEMAELASLQTNAPVQVNVYTLPDWSGMKHAIGGGPWLVKDGHAYVDLGAQHFSSRGLGYREPRSAVGITGSGKMLLVAVDGRQSGSVGMTLNELALLMTQLGAVQAMNLDGGSSTQMAVHGKVVNMPSAGQIGVSNSLIVRQLNTDNMALQRNEKAF